jgi:hypothetical protein
MEKVDRVIGGDRLLLFAEAISDTMMHLEEDESSLCGCMPRSQGAQVVVQIICAVTELETAWNNLRLSNVPAAHRQSRVAMECLALSVLMALPRRDLERLPKKLDFSKIILANPVKSIKDLISPGLSLQGQLLRREEPPLRGSAIYPAFLAAARDLLGLPVEVVENFRTYQRQVQHPASHASFDNFMRHFDAFVAEGRAGAFFTPERAETYCRVADDLINIATWMSEILEKTRERLQSKPQPVPGALNPGPQAGV